MSSPIKILAINSSPRFKGNTARLLELFIKSAKKLDVSVERVDLYKEMILPVSGKLGVKIKKLQKLHQKMVECDGFVIATPTYWFNMPGVLKNFLDSFADLEDNGWLLEGKVGGFIVYSPEGGEIGTLQSLILPLNHQGVVIPPYAAIFNRGIKEDNWALKDIPLLAKNMVKQIKMQKESKVNWGY